MSKTSTPVQVDRSQLHHLIEGLAEGIIVFDATGITHWANPPALQMHEVEAVGQLGETGRDYGRQFKLHYRNHQAVTGAQHPVNRLLAGETFEDVVVQLTKPGDDEFKRILKLRGLILRNAADQAETLVLVMQDETERFSAEERFERAFGANPAPALICRQSDLRYVKVNAGFLALSGYRSEQVLGRSAYEIDVLASASRREQAIENLHAGKTIPQTESLLRIADGSDRLVIVAGQPLEMGDEPCMLFTFMDLEPRRQAAEALRHSEERFSKAFRLAPVPIVIFELDGLRTLAVNEAFSEVTGLAADKVQTRSMRDLKIWGDPDAVDKLASRLEAQGAVKDAELTLLNRAGEASSCLLSAESAVIDEQRCVLCVLQDVSERKRSEAELMAAIDAVMQDASWFSRSVIEKLAQLRHPTAAGDAGNVLAALTPREREVLELMCEGLDNDQIAHRLHRSLNTVRNHVATLYAKIGVHRRDAAVVWARDRGITGKGAAPRRRGADKS